jgi:hypothetical protein
MMKALFHILLPACFAGAAMVISTAAPATTVINFTDQTFGSHTGSLVYPEATFTSDTGYIYVGATLIEREICPFDPNSFDCAHGLTVTFTDPVNNLSFNSFGDNFVSNIFVAVTTTGGTFNFTGSTDGISTDFDTVDLSAYSNITSLFITNDDFAGLAYDYFAFDAGAVGIPEPSTWAMMLLGFGAVGSALRRRSKSPGPLRL